VSVVRQFESFGIAPGRFTLENVSTSDRRRLYKAANLLMWLRLAEKFPRLRGRASRRKLLKQRVI